MQGFSIHFTYPWLLLLLIPAAVLTVLPYFFLSKRYRRTRNRIISMVMHGIVMLLAILALSGISFHYTVHNDENEVLILVDMSDTQQICSDRRDAFVEEVVTEGGYDGFKMGIVTFGFDQRYAVPFTFDTDSIINAYYESELPDTTATDIAAALRYAATLFEHPETAKIVLVSDGQQTDENARSVARSIAAQGIKIDTVNISEAVETDGVRVTNITFPTYHVGLNEECSVDVELFGVTNGSVATVELTDKGDKSQVSETKEVELIPGTQIVSFRKTFTEQGVHEIVVRASVNGDTLENNNEYHSFFNVEVFTRVLILEQQDQSQQLVEILKEAEIPYSADVVNVKMEPEKVPKSLDALRNYDQVILNNIANSDLPAGFDALLYSYVSTVGGGLFTTGGTVEGEAHAYNRRDLVNTLYQQMLPVQAIDYTPPVGVEIVIDVSGSMQGDKLEAAKEGAVDCLDVLTDRDYVGIVTLSTTYGTILQPTRRTQDAIIKEAIESVKIQGNTTYSSAISRAGEALRSLKQVDKRHIIIVSDGAPTEAEDQYLPIAEKFYRENEITISVVAIQMPSGQYDAMDRLTSSCGGKLYMVDDLSRLGALMQDDLSAPAIKETDQVEFHPVIVDPLSNLAAGIEHEDFEEEEEGGGLATRWRLKTTLDGFYGTRARASADTVVVGEYGVPIYSQWKFGKGMVGSFMCDVYGEWSSAFLADANGRLFLRNVVGNLMPTENIRSSEITLNLREENYINQLGISASLDVEGGERIDGEIVYLGDGSKVSLSTPEEEISDDLQVTTYLSAANSYSRCNFVAKNSGLYRITVRKIGADGEVKAEAELYKAFAYSKEYSTWEDTDGSTDSGALLAQLSERGGGKEVDEYSPWSVFEEFVTEFERVYDPRILFMITSIILFLIDILVRKFKFKWLHEIIREHKANKAEKQQ